ncbi:hypothetical protein Holit_02965 [Hollandina sp. SP2]
MPIDAVYERLKGGSIKRVVLFGDSMKVPAPPYVVIKPEADTGNETRRIRIIAHAEQGQQTVLEDYVFTELPVLLGKSVWMTDRNKSRFRLVNSGEWTEVMLGNDDKTIAMERVFILPKRLH